MAKNNYDIKFLPSFDNEFDEVLYYIMYQLNNRKAAEKIYNSVINAILTRSKFPEIFEKYKQNKKTKYNWYRIHIKNFTIFYIVRNNTMEIVHFVYKKRDLDKLI